MEHFFFHFAKTKSGRKDTCHSKIRKRIKDTRKNQPLLQEFLDLYDKVIQITFFNV